MGLVARCFACCALCPCFAVLLCVVPLPALLPLPFFWGGVVLVGLVARCVPAVLSAPACRAALRCLSACCVLLPVGARGLLVVLCCFGPCGWLGGGWCGLPCLLAACFSVVVFSGGGVAGVGGCLPAGFCLGVGVVMANQMQFSVQACGFAPPGVRRLLLLISLTRSVTVMVCR